MIKLNDPIGFSFKLEEYFSIEVFNIPFLEPWALTLAVMVCIAEIILGVMLIVGLWKKLTLWLLFAMTVFFGFLTFYSAYFNKVTDCGCFGDAIKFTPWQSFFKDIFLMGLIIFLLIFKQFICCLKQKIALIITFISLLFCFGLFYYVYNHLPIIDFRPYKVRSNIPSGMIYPEDAPKPVYDYHWKFEKDGKEYIITTQGDYPTTDGKFISVDTQEIEKGYVPPIHDFSIEKEGEDFTEEFMKEPKLMMVISYNANKANNKAFAEIKKVTDQALKNGYKVIGLTYTVEKADKLGKEYEFNFPFYLCDETTLKTIIRSNPGILVLDRGTIIKKLHYNDVHQFKL